MMLRWTTYRCAPGYHKGRAAVEHTGGPGCTSIWDCAGRCAPLPQGGIYSPRKKSYVIFTINMNLRSLSVKGERGRADQGQNSALARFKAEERSNDDPANHESLASMYTSSAGVND